MGMVGNAALPLWTGKEITLKTVAIDPRSILRGEYAQLRYEIGAIPDDALGGSTSTHRRTGVCNAQGNK